MARFVFLTKTLWTEPPRIRHQLAHLLARAGHDVLFFEKPTLGWGQPAAPRSVTERITIVGFQELVHHKLRVTKLLHRLNARVAQRSIARALDHAACSANEAVVVNFNYDYWFLRRVFPGNTVVTMINDDFLSNAPFGITRHLRWALSRTCALSNRVLTVSTPLQEQLSRYATAELFLPWADRSYQLPAAGCRRDVLLFWGFINRKIDFPLVESLASRLAAERPDMQLLFAGPVEQGVDSQMAALSRYPNIEVWPATPLDELPIDRVFASIIPYRTGSADIDAIMLPNKALQLLPRGIPLVISGLPHFIIAPFVFHIDSTMGDGVLDDIRTRFDSLQPSIRDFVAQHHASARLAQFEAIAGIVTGKVGATSLVHDRAP